MLFMAPWLWKEEEETEMNRREGLLRMKYSRNLLVNIFVFSIWGTDEK